MSTTTFYLSVGPLLKATITTDEAGPSLIEAISKTGEVVERIVKTGLTNEAILSEGTGELRLALPCEEGLSSTAFLGELQKLRLDQMEFELGKKIGEISLQEE